MVKVKIFSNDEWTDEDEQKYPGEMEKLESRVNGFLATIGDKLVDVKVSSCATSDEQGEETQNVVMVVLYKE